jgi:hypothetical protein
LVMLRNGLQFARKGIYRKLYFVDYLLTLYSRVASQLGCCGRNGILFLGQLIRVNLNTSHIV